MSLANIYVDTDSGSSGNGGTSWVDAMDTLANGVAKLVGPMDTPCVIHCRGAAADTTAVNVTGKTSTATDTITIQTDAADRHDGKWNTGKYRLEITITTAHAVQSNENYITWDGLQIKVTSSSADNFHGLAVGTPAGADNCVVKNNIVWGALSGTATNNYGIISYGVTNATTIRNNIVYGWINGGSTIHGIGSGNGPANYYNNTVINCYNAFNVIDGTVEAKNNYGSGSVGTYVGTYSVSTTNAASDTDADAAYQSIAADTSQFVNVTIGTSTDLHIVDTASKLYHTVNAGTDLSGTFTDDIDGQTRVSWDIGADEFIVGDVAITASGGTLAMTGIATVLRAGAKTYLRYAK